MRTISKFCLSLMAVSSLALTGCQQYIKPQEQPPASGIEAPDQFNLQGKIGVRTPQQSGSAFFTWAQEQQDFDIELSGILGVGKTQISGKAGEVTLNSAKTGLVSAATPEELLERATGWQAPITHLVKWVQAKPATQQAQLNKDDSGRIAQIQEDGWQVDLSYADSATLPNKLILKQALETGKENRITMVIQNR
ncbi:lipoprotein insertase outer membrane protein LolB [Acinetobacter sp. ANC 3813]|uniref:lipoprotein insertase outer membrane protein LolB n=1 Tax=Acinetobacter sp. ANC 3813 TaxID=1977873 RepID=UPI000A341447|nr:lipoprotein insertase outer membrane protein LolB [Acinetobacter sp. ANC 3813]OTG92025.1 outer membrane lipoprotein LolB [Acinetobacter sp. ANC 3813]